MAALSNETLSWGSPLRRGRALARRVGTSRSESAERASAAPGSPPLESTHRSGTQISLARQPSSVYSPLLLRKQHPAAMFGQAISSAKLGLKELQNPSPGDRGRMFPTHPGADSQISPRTTPISHVVGPHWAGIRKKYSSVGPQPTLKLLLASERQPDSAVRRVLHQLTRPSWRGVHLSGDLSR